MRETLRTNTVNQPVGVAEVVIETRSDDAGRQGMTNIADVLANLIPDVRHLGRRRRSLQVDENRRTARAGVAAQEIQTTDLLQLSLDALSHLRQRVVQGGAGPRRLHDHGPEGERGILVAAESKIGCQT